MRKAKTTAAPRSWRRSRHEQRSEAKSARTDLLNGSSDPLKHLSNNFITSIISLQINASCDKLSMDLQTLRCPTKDRFGLHIRVSRNLASASKSQTFLQSRFSFRGCVYCQWHRLTKPKQTSGCFPLFSHSQLLNDILSSTNPRSAMNCPRASKQNQKQIGRAHV